MTQRELVERMLDADFEARAAGRKWQNCDPTTQKRFLEGMSAALKVAVEELLGPIRSDEWSYIRHCQAQNSVIPVIDGILADRKSRILSPPKPPTLVDRIKPILDKWYNQPCDTQSLAEEVVREMEKKS